MPLAPISQVSRSAVRLVRRWDTIQSPSNDWMSVLGWLSAWDVKVEPSGGAGGAMLDELGHYAASSFRTMGKESRLYQQGLHS